MTATDDTGVENPKVKPPKQSAAGVPAVMHALEYSLEQTSLVRTAINLLNINQNNGIDCPGCAWPEPEPGQRHRNEYCENGAKHINDEATTRRITRKFFRDHSISELATKSDMWLNEQGRLTEPMVKRPGSDYYEPIGWDGAPDLPATELPGLDSPDEALFYTSGRLSNEAAFLLQEVTGSLGPGTPIADQFLHIKPCGDLALFQAINALLLEAEDAAPGRVLDLEFVDTHTAGFAEFADHVRQIAWSDVLDATGLSREEIEQVVERVLSSRRVVACSAMGVTQQKYGVATVREIVNFLMLRGNLGRTGTGVCPVRGHSNVQGDRTMGIWEKMPQSFLDALEQEVGFTPPTAHGLDAVDSVRAMRDGRAKLFVGFAGNFVRATPDSELTEQAMRSCRLTAHISTKLNLSHAVCGETALILPTLGRSDRDIQASGEQFVTVEDSMSIVHLSRGRLTPASDHLLSEVAIVCRLARRTLLDTPTIPWEDFESAYDVIRAAITRVVPDFEDFNARVRKPGGFRLANPVNEYRFDTPSGKAVFTCNTFDRIRVPPGHLVLQTMRSHDQWNTVPYAPNDRYRGIKNGRRIVLVNPADIEALGLADRQLVDLVSTWEDGVERRAQDFRVIAYPAARGSAASYYPETNVLVPLDSVADISNTPTSKGVFVRFEPADKRSRSSERPNAVIASPAHS